jgi:hypothetical protein
MVIYWCYVLNAVVVGNDADVLEVFGSRMYL